MRRRGGCHRIPPGSLPRGRTAHAPAEATSASGPVRVAQARHGQFPAALRPATAEQVHLGPDDPLRRGRVGTPGPSRRDQFGRDAHHLGPVRGDWTDAIGMDGAQVAVASYRPAWWPARTEILIRRVRLDISQMSVDARSRRRRTAPFTQWIQGNQHRLDARRAAGRQHRCLAAPAHRHQRRW